MKQIDLACPNCGGRVVAPPAGETNAANCPKCGRPLQLPPPPPSPPPPPAQTAPPPGEPPVVPVSSSDPPAAEPPTESATPISVRERAPVRPLTREERERQRRRMSVASALVGLAILVIAWAVLLFLRP